MYSAAHAQTDLRDAFVAKTSVWHYTIGLHAEKILQCGFIRCATKHVPLNERPLVWFSMNQDFEPTATRGKIVDGVRSSMSISEMMEFGRGLVRFGLPPRTLLTGENLKRRARISSREWTLLQKTAKKAGSGSHDWFGSTEPVDTTRCIFEVRTQAGMWERVVPSDWLIQTALVQH